MLLEVEGGDEALFESWTTSLFERGLIEDGTMAQHSTQAAELWALREGISESLSATGLPHKNDVALPVAALEAFCADLGAVFASRYPGWEVCLFGHIGDGNLHINIMKPEGMEKPSFLAKTKDADHDLFALVKKHAGSISAEHGIGLLKKPYLGYSRSPDEMALMRSIKRALDPNGILNPGKVIDAVQERPRQPRAAQPHPRRDRRALRRRGVRRCVLLRALVNEEVRPSDHQPRDSDAEADRRYRSVSRENASRSPCSEGGRAWSADRRRCSTTTCWPIAAAPKIVPTATPATPNPAKSTVAT